MRLYCFPWSGAGASVYRNWARLLPDEVELCAMQLPGHEDRLAEPPSRDVTRAGELLAEAIAAERLPFAFFGHSLGALLAFKTARALRRQCAPAPRHLFVSGFRGPQVERLPSSTYLLPDKALIERLRGIGGTPELVLQNAELMALLLPPLRADFEMIARFRYTHEVPFAFPITAFGGREDPEATPEELAWWQHETTAAFERVLFPGGHFYLQEGRRDLLAALSKRLHEHA